MQATQVRISSYNCVRSKKVPVIGTVCTVLICFGITDPGHTSEQMTPFFSPQDIPVELDFQVSPTASLYVGERSNVSTG